jgi:hypothetical protein
MWLSRAIAVFFLLVLIGSFAMAVYIWTMGGDGIW